MKAYDSAKASAISVADGCDHQEGDLGPAGRATLCAMAGTSYNSPTSSSWLSRCVVTRRWWGSAWPQHSQQPPSPAAASPCWRRPGRRHDRAPPAAITDTVTINREQEAGSWVWKEMFCSCGNAINCQEKKPMLSAERVHKIFRHISDKECLALSATTSAWIPSLPFPTGCWWKRVSHWVVAMLPHGCFHYHSQSSSCSLTL